MNKLSLLWETYFDPTSYPEHTTLNLGPFCGISNADIESIDLTDLFPNIKS